MGQRGTPVAYLGCGTDSKDVLGTPIRIRLVSGRGEIAVLEFILAYGLWIALAGVFVAMHWFGAGCCGGRRRSRSALPSEKAAGGSPGSETVSDAGPRSAGRCH